MAKLCIRVTPNPNTTDPKLDSLRTQEGDVVWVAEDDHVFSFGELNCGQYKFVDIPGKQEDFIYLMEPVVDIDETMIAIRKLSLDSSALKTVFWSDKTAATKTELDSITITKTVKG